MDDGPRRPHTGRRRNDAAQAAILDAAFRLLGGPGTEPLTIDAIAAEAGVGRQTIYRWWPSKGAVVADALARHARVVVPERDTGSFAGDLAAFFIDSFAGLENESYADR
ncbi:MAG TPA: helix-turn-helix domain-containing protein, partial [Trebonia sp.]|nr:helix-turn-helix domain-containing protein [Trebonia sp.]